MRPPVGQPPALPPAPWRDPPRARSIRRSTARNDATHLIRVGFRSRSRVNVRHSIQSTAHDVDPAVANAHKGPHGHSSQLEQPVVLRRRRKENWQVRPRRFQKRQQPRPRPEDRPQPQHQRRSQDRPHPQAVTTAAEHAGRTGSALAINVAAMLALACSLRASPRRRPHPPRLHVLSCWSTLLRSPASGAHCPIHSVFA